VTADPWPWGESDPTTDDGEAMAERMHAEMGDQAGVGYPTPEQLAAERSRVDRARARQLERRRDWWRASKFWQRAQARDDAWRR
jgi:hypothetical protein